MLFVCEDNRWSATTASGPMTAGDGASARAEAMDIAADAGRRQRRVRGARGRRPAGRARCARGSGPRLLHALTYRVKGHVSVDPAAYRDPAELAAALRDRSARACARPPARTTARARHVLDAIDDEAQAEVEAALAAADAAPWPEAGAAFTDVQTTGAGQWT